MKIELLKKLCDTPGVSGDEARVREIVAGELKGHATSMFSDVMGNLVVEKRGTGSRPKLMLSAHMDEVGFIVALVEKEGYLRFRPVGGIDVRLASDLRVIVHGKKDYPGVIGTRAPHLQKEEEKTQVPKWEDLFIDIGAKDKKQVEEMGISPGSFVSFASRFQEMAGTKVCSKALDNRSSVYILIEVIKALKNFKGVVHAVFAAQEEVGLKGAKTAAFKINPDIALAVDVSNAGDSPNVKPIESEGALGKGPSIVIMEAEGRGLMVPEKIKKMLIETAKRSKIPYQPCLTVGGMTEGAIIQLSREGIPTGALGVPVRYMHSAGGVLDTRDIDKTIKLLVEVIKNAGKYI